MEIREGFRRVFGLAIAVGLFVAGPSVAATTMVGSGPADANGKCAIDINVDPSVSPDTVAEELRQYAELSGGAKLESVSVENGVAHLECSGAAPNSTVEVYLPTDVATLVGAGGAGGGGISTTAIVAGSVLGATGAGLGACAAADCFEGEEEIPATGMR
jgi:hypothetical protein